MAQFIFWTIFMFILGFAIGAIAITFIVQNKREISLCTTCTLRADGSCPLYHYKGIRVMQCNNYDGQGDL